MSDLIKSRRRIGIIKEPLLFKYENNISQITTRNTVLCTMCEVRIEP